MSFLSTLQALNAKVTDHLNAPQPLINTVSVFVFNATCSLTSYRLVTRQKQQQSHDTLYCPIQDCSVYQTQCRVYNHTTSVWSIAVSLYKVLCEASLANSPYRQTTTSLTTKLHVYDEPIKTNQLPVVRVAADGMSFFLPIPQLHSLLHSWD